ncbi:MAG: hypothetical protein HQL39_19545 [Alphaproteobacteria bacterium]|nr:hypothetical protein [Alphaproteobacteria bacterium]
MSKNSPAATNGNSKYQADNVNRSDQAPVIGHGSQQFAVTYTGAPLSLVLDGGKDDDSLVLTLSATDAARDEVRADLARLSDWAAAGQSHDASGLHGETLVLDSLGLTLRNIEAVEVVVTGSPAPDAFLFTVGADSVVFDMLSADQASAVAAGADLYDALAGDDFVKLPTTSAKALAIGWDAVRVFRAGDGADTIFGGNDMSETIDGGEGADNLIGGLYAADHLIGGGGDDRLTGGAGADVLEGGIGKDTLLGGAGDDAVDGGEGDDNLSGWEGDDVVDGGAGLDYLTGNSGNDTLNGGDGDDTLFGNDGDDLMIGGAGNDYINADIGADTLDGGAGADYLQGAGGDDLIVVRIGDNQAGETDTAIGGADFDTLRLDFADQAQYSAFASDIQAFETALAAASAGSFVSNAALGVKVLDIEAIDIRVAGQAASYLLV